MLRIAHARLHPQHCPAHAHSNPLTQAVTIVHPKGLEPSCMLSQLWCTLLRAAIRMLDRKNANRYSRAQRANSKGSMNCMPTLSCRQHPLNSGNYSQLQNHNDTRGRTTQALPRETQVIGQMRRQKNYNYREGMFIISLPYIG